MDQNVGFLRVACGLPVNLKVALTSAVCRHELAGPATPGIKLSL